MSSIGAINSANITFQGRKTENKKGGKVKKFASKLAQPVKDAFNKKYQTHTGEKVKPTPKLVADFVSDILVKGAIATAGTALLFIKSRKITNGLTAAFRKNYASVSDDVAKSASGKVSKIKDVLCDTIDEVQKKNLDEKLDAKQQSLSFVKRLKNAIFKPKETFQNDSMLGKGIDKHFKNPEKAKENFKAVGVDCGDSLADLADSVALTTAASIGVLDITDDVTSADDAELAKTEAEEEKAEETESCDELEEKAAKTEAEEEKAADEKTKDTAEEAEESKSSDDKKTRRKGFKIAFKNPNYNEYANSALKIIEGLEKAV